MSSPGPGTSRRSMIAAAASGLIAGAVAPAHSAAATVPLTDLRKEADIACVYHCDFGDPPRFMQMLTNIGNHYSACGADPFALQLAIVAHGPGVKFFLENLDGTSWHEEVLVPKTFERVKDIARNGLKVHLCEITFERLKIDKAKARQADFVGFVPSGVAAVAALQARGFGYMKIG